MRVVVNLRSHRRPSRRRALVSPTPALVAHMELPESDNVIWHTLAAETIDWATKVKGITGLRELVLDHANRLGE